jgi:hypothetical protein
LSVARLVIEEGSVQVSRGGAAGAFEVVAGATAILRGMAADALDTEYENGVADVLAYLARDAASVQRNIRLPGKKSGKRRQIDVLVSGSIFGSDWATMVVDCKRYAKPIDVNHVGAFVALVEDVAADIGLLVSTVGISEAAQHYADNVRGIRLKVISLGELDEWTPCGTVHFDYAVRDDLYSEALRVARRVGFRARPIEVEPWRGDCGLGLRLFRHFGVLSPSGDQQAEACDALLKAWKRIGVLQPVGLGSGITVSGGTPNHRWLEVSLAGDPIGLKVLASSEGEIAEQLDRVVSALPPGVVRSQLDVVRPEIWPIPTMFPPW